VIGRCYKRGYPTAVAAWRQVRRALRKHAPPLTVYRCRQCGCWHLTSMTEYEPGLPTPRRMSRERRRRQEFDDG
jgi:hypothetical protein